MRRASRGYVLLDYVLAAAIFASAVALFVATTNLKYRLLGGAENRMKAVRAATSELEQVRARELPQIALAEAKAEAKSPLGWVTYRSFDVPGLARAEKEPPGVVTVRRAADRGWLEVRVSVTWRAEDKHPLTYSVSSLVRPPRKREF